MFVTPNGVRFTHKVEPVNGEYVFRVMERYEAENKDFYASYHVSLTADEVGWKTDGENWLCDVVTDAFVQLQQKQDTLGIAEVVIYPAFLGHDESFVR